MDRLNDITLPKNGEKIHIGKLIEPAISYCVYTLAQKNTSLTVVLLPDIHLAEKLHRELENLLLGTNIPVKCFSDWETLPYDHFSPHQDITSSRLKLLSELGAMPKGIIIVAIGTLLQPVPPKSYLLAQSLSVAVGDKLDLIQKRRELEQAGYLAVNQVVSRGEFALRGAIIDIFPMGADYPIRLELFDDEIETIRLFNPDDQRSTGNVSAFKLLPAREYPLDAAALKRFEDNWDEAFGNPGLSPILNETLNGRPPPGIDYYLPLFFEQHTTLIDYLPPESLLLSIGDIQEAATAFMQEAKTRFTQLSADIERPILAPERLFMSKEVLNLSLNNYRHIALSKTSAKQHNLDITALPDLNISQSNNALTSFLKENAALTPVLFCASSFGRAEKLSESLTAMGQISPVFESLAAFLASKEPRGLMISPIEASFWIKNYLLVITESNLLNQPIVQSRRRKTRENPLQAVIKDLSALKIGEAVVHLEHGIGRYLGIQTIDTHGISADYLTLEYLGDDKLYVPITSLNLISRYSGVDNKNPPLYGLGKAAWQKAKDKALKRIRDVAAELLEVYAKRSEKVGLVMKVDTEYDQFAAEFPFEETPDQETAIDAVIGDLAKARPMDRLLCGDVGFGKTEVAMRAAFIAVQNGKQVTILVPTTLLANQHFTNFQDRFAKWPVNIEMLSRFKTQKQQKIIMEKLAAGNVDIIIGTHKLLASNIAFKDLGLLVIDEEHRFGVRHKEKIKALRTNVDILTMSATPIPRTLNMAMSEIRDLSIIATPPLRRRNVETFIYDYAKSWIVEAISREVSRGGQVYFLHNDVKSMAKIEQDISSWFPDLKITTAHGQMPERQLEGIMSKFYHNHYHVLICTTIIESGIDIPNANTIIMNKADKLGLGQLHQIRGRVGRSHHQAYAYLLVPNKEALARDAKRRLDAFQQSDSLGAGFILASHDLEIRGAGELLGAEQSGHLQSIGFNLYMELLQAATKALKNDGTLAVEENLLAQSIDVDLSLSTIIPETYLGDVNMRLGFYKRISSAKNEHELAEIEIEMIDRFGILPTPTKQLFSLSNISLQARALGIATINATDKRISISFSDKPNLDFDKLIKLVQTNPKTYQFAGSTKLVHNGTFTEPKARMAETKALLERIH